MAEQYRLASPAPQPEDPGTYLGTRAVDAGDQAAASYLQLPGKDRRDKLPIEHFNDQHDQTWAGIRDDFRQRFPQIPEQKAAQAFYDQSQQAFHGAMVKRYQDRMEQKGGVSYGAAQVPFFGGALSTAQSEAVQQAPERMQKGLMRDIDYALIARHLQEAKESEQRGTLGEIGYQLSKLPAFVGEMYATGAGAAGGTAKQAVAGRISAALGESLPARTAAFVGGQAAFGLTAQAAMPQQTAAAFAERQAPPVAVTDQGLQIGDQKTSFESLKNLGGAYGMGALNLGVLGSLTGEGAGGVVNFLKRVGTGLGEQQLVDVAGGLTGMQTGYGAMGDLLQGKYGEALKKGAVQASTFAAFAALHGQDPKAVLDSFKNKLGQLRSQGLSAEGAGRHFDQINWQEVADKAPFAPPEPPQGPAERAPEAVPPAGPVPRPLPAEAATEQPGGGKLYHIADYKNPANSVNAATAMLERKGSPVTHWVWDGPENAQSADANLQNKAAVLQYDRAGYQKAHGADAIEPQGTGTSLARGKFPVPYDPSLERVFYKGKPEDPGFQKLKTSVDEANSKRADADLMKEYGHEGALDPIRLEAAEKFPQQAQEPPKTGAPSSPEPEKAQPPPEEPIAPPAKAPEPYLAPQGTGRVNPELEELFAEPPTEKPAATGPFRPATPGLDELMGMQPVPPPFQQDYGPEGHHGATRYDPAEARAEAAERAPKPSLAERMKAKGRQEVPTPEQPTQAPRPVRETPEAQSEYEKAGLTPLEQHVYGKYKAGLGASGEEYPSFLKMSQDPEVLAAYNAERARQGMKPAESVSDQTVKNIADRAHKKLGNEGSLYATVAADAKARALARGEIMDHEAHDPATQQARVSMMDQEDKIHGQLDDLIEKRSRGEIDDDELIRRSDDLYQQAQKLAGSAYGPTPGEAPVRPPSAGGVPPAEQSAEPPAEGTPGPAQGVPEAPAAAAPGGEAAGNVVEPAALRLPGQPRPPTFGPPPPPVARPVPNWGDPRTGLWDAFLKLFSPHSRGPAAEVGGGILRAGLAKFRRQDAVANAALANFRWWADNHIQGAPDDATREQRFRDIQRARETGNVAALSPEARAYEDAYRPLQDEMQREAVARGLLDPQNVIKNYVGHLVEKDNGQPADPEVLQSLINAKRGLAGSEGFRKRRVFDVWDDVLDAGYRPKGNNWNIVDIDMAKLHEVAQSIRHHDMFEAWKSKQLTEWYGLGEKGPDGWREPNDPKFKSWAPPEKQVPEFVDKVQTEKLEGLAQRLGINVSTRTTGPLGLQQGDNVSRRFAAPVDHVLPHEITHWIDDNYPDLRQRLAANPHTAQELRNLADARASGQVSQDYRDYLRKPEEQIANLGAAYVHAPELLDQIAPNARYIFDTFLTDHPELSGLRDAKPSLQFDKRMQTIRLAGPQLTGRWLMPDPLAHLVDNYLSVGAKGNPLWEAYSAAKNASAQFILGASGFHALFEGHVSIANGIANAIQKASRGEWLGASKSLLTENPIADIRKAVPLLREYYKPGSGSPEVVDGMNRMIKSGFGADIDPTEWGNNFTGLRKTINDIRFAYRRGELAGQLAPGAKALGLTGATGNIPKPVKAAAQAMGALAEFTSYPVMRLLTPMLKTAGAARITQNALDSLPSTATDDVKTAAVQKSFEAIEDRMGQMMYDNIGWHNGLKQLLQGTMLSPSWNFGTARVALGGVKDIPKSAVGILKGEGVTPRTAFLMATTLTAGAIGMLLNKLMTGEWPQDIKDFFWPRDGTMSKDGTPNRLRFPGYHNDIASAALGFSEGGVMGGVKHFAEMGKGKLTGFAKMPADIASNEDYFGNPIWDEKAGGTQQVRDFLGHVLGDNFNPISVKILQQQLLQGKEAPAAAASALAGVGPAPRSITHTPEQLRKSKAKGEFFKGVKGMREPATSTGPKTDKEKEDQKLRERGLLP